VFFLELIMTESKEDKAKKEAERRKSERFAWLGPLLERRKARAEPIEETDEEHELEEIES
jgi:hypothetical protein